MARQDRIAQLIALLEDAITTGNDDLVQEVRSDLFREYGLNMNRGGMANMDYMTRPIHMNSGGDPALKDLLGQLRLQLMLEKGMPGSTLMPSGNPDKIKRLEKRIKEIKIELGE